MARPFTVAATGDTLVTQRIGRTADPGFHALVDLLHSADVRFTNLEGTLHEFEGFPQAASGGTYVCGHPGVIEDLKGLGFNLYSAANNHMVDWGEGGLFATMKTLDRAGVTYAGIGRHLQEARAPRYLETPAGRVALLAATSTFPAHAPAGEQRPDCQGRPGVNPLRFQEVVDVDSETLAQLTDFYRRLGLGAVRDLRIRLGFERPDPPGITTLFDRKFRLGDPAGIRTELHAGDLAGHLTWIRDARRQADWVVVSVHAHEMRGEREQPAEFIPSFCRQAVEAGADIVVGHGPHLLRGMEVYRGKPIFYSLGNFIFQNETVLRQPADFYERLRRRSGLLGVDRAGLPVWRGGNAGGGSAVSRDPGPWIPTIPAGRARAGIRDRRADDHRARRPTLAAGADRLGRGWIWHRAMVRDGPAGPRLASINTLFGRGTGSAVAAIVFMLLFVPPAGAPPVPPAFPQTCGPYALTVSAGAGPRGSGSVSFRREGRPRYRLDAYGVLEVACTHLTGHRDPDAIVTESTGGGSCCEAIEVIQLSGGPHRVLRFDGKVLGIRDDLGRQSRQIAALLSVFRFFGGLCGACSPGLPVVYVYDGRRFVERSSRVPAPVIAYATRERKELGAPGPGDSQRRRGAALGILAAYMVLGREAEGWRIVSTAPSAVTGWLHQHEEELRRVIAGVRE